MALQSSLSSSSSSSYDVFLSFRGADTRYGFTGNLYNALVHKGIRTFFDEDDLESGEEITPSLLKAIQESRIAIIVFSTNYASSSFCLDELVHIKECVKEKGRYVLPVFYDVDPSDVRHQRGSYAEALAKLERRFKDSMEKVNKWREALHQVANLSGYHFNHGDGYEHKFIGDVVKAVSSKIRRVALPVADYLVGLESQVLKVTSLLDVGSNDGVHMVGIHGIGGIGKTTLALAVYNSIADHFEGTCFLENVRENSNKYGLVHLQSILLYQLLGEKEIKLTSVRQGISMIQRRLQKKKVLLILDDVEELKQLQAIVGKSDWFAPGSRVIITTRDQHLLSCHLVERTFEVKGINEADALELLIWKAFKTDIVSSSYVNVLSRAITYACGLPLALEVIGSNLFGKNVENWESALDRYEKIPNSKIQTILEVSFDSLEEDEKNVFLDIACCFKGYELAEVESMLCAHHGSCMKYHIGVLVKKSLIKIARFGKVILHDLIADMGKEIVRRESPTVPGKRSRLWFHDDILQVLEDNKGTDKIEIIHLGFPFSEEEEEEKLVVEWNGKAFKKMKNLKTLIIINCHFFEAPKHLPNSLRVLDWWRYPSQYLPSNFNPKKLIVCKLRQNDILPLELAVLSKEFVNLKDLNLDYSASLTEIPDVSCVPNLEKFSFISCLNLETIHPSIGFLGKLKSLSAEHCEKLRSFPPIKLTSLEELKLSFCPRLEKFPEILEKMEKLTRLDLKWTGIKGLPFSFRNLTRLQELNMDGNWNFGAPTSIVMMAEPAEMKASSYLVSSSGQDKGEETMMSLLVSSKVNSVNLSICNVSDDFLAIGLAWFCNVKELNLSHNKFTILPACLKECRFLRKLVVDWCEHLCEVRGVPPNLEYFSAEDCTSWTSSCSSLLLNQELHEARDTDFTLPGDRIPEWFEHRSRGTSFSFWFRNNIPSIALCCAFQLPNCWVEIVTRVTLNGCGGFPRFSKRLYLPADMDYIFLFNLGKVICDHIHYHGLLENEWNHFTVSSTSTHWLSDERFSPEMGIHVFNQKSSMEEDIRFTDPYKRRKLDDGLSSPES